MEDVTAALSGKKQAIGILCDLSKAFDSVNHELLLLKLYHYGVRGLANNWFKSYLTNRKQSVVINGVDLNNTVKNVYSKELTIVQGIPQGSTLGSLLFPIYFNDLPVNINNAKSTIFADDTSLLITDNLITNVEDEIYQLNLNSNKTRVTKFKTKCISAQPMPVVSVNGNTLKITDRAPFLGIELDEQLN